jgi:bifunctional DNase/RNase
MPVEMHLLRIVRDEQLGHPLIVLKEVNGHRLLPILIGMNEAIAIHRALHGFKCPRPATHDLVVSLIEALDGQPDSVEMTNLGGNTYHASISITRGKERFTVDARPSDAIALALTVQPVLPIYVDEQLLEEAGRPDDRPVQKPSPHIEGEVSCAMNDDRGGVGESPQTNPAPHVHSGHLDTSEPAVFVQREFAFGIFFPPSCVHPKLFVRDNELLIDTFLNCRNLRKGEVQHRGVVALTGLDERPVPGTRHRFRDVKPIGDAGAGEP